MLSLKKKNLIWWWKSALCFPYGERILTREGHAETFWGLENALYLDLVVFTWVYPYVKTHWEVYLMHFMVYMLYLIKKYFKTKNTCP